MIISELWLREWVSSDKSVAGIADCLTLAGLEVEGVNRVSEPIDHLLVGRVLSVEPHPDADRLRITRVDIGGGDPLDIVCGASNVSEGLRVAVAQVGAQLPNGMQIKAAQVRGVDSNGMLCSASELGLAEHSEGILELDANAIVGQRVDEYLQLQDNLIDIDLTPNRGDCLSLQGVARELKVLADAEYHPPIVTPVATESDLKIDIELLDDAACPRYLGRVIEGINAAATTPLWLQERLRRCGVRPISAVVDITNYVMLELGQPMHAFDLTRLDTSIEVRRARAGERIKLLDESEANLREDTLVIADSAGPIAIAGVMGGAHSAIDSKTDTVVLEAAHFTRKAVAGTARSYGLHTESSHRFERGVDPQLPTIAIERASEMVLTICGGRAGPICEQTHSSGVAGKPSVLVSLAKLNRLLGMSLHAEAVESVLGRVTDTLESHTATAGDEYWVVTPPSYRFDIEYEADLVEEVARVQGYDSIPTALPRIVPKSKVASERHVDLRSVKQSLIARDFREIISYSFIDPVSQAQYSEEAPLVVRNPLAENMSVMRTSLLPGLLSAMQYNLKRQRDRVRLFEVGTSYHREGGKIRERQRLAGAITGPAQPQQWGDSNKENADFYDLKGDLNAVLSLTGHKEPFIFNEFEHIAMQSGQVSQLNRGDSDGQFVEIGLLGRLHPNLQKSLGAAAAIFAFEIDLEPAMQAELPVFAEVSKFPFVKRDISIVVNADVAVSKLLETVRNQLGVALMKVQVFDVYAGEGVEPGHKSVSLSLVLQHPDKTMTDAESEQLVQAALADLGRDYSATLRA